MLQLSPLGARPSDFWVPQLLEWYLSVLSISSFWKCPAVPACSLAARTHIPLAAFWIFPASYGISAELFCRSLLFWLLKLCQAHSMETVHSATSSSFVPARPSLLRIRITNLGLADMCEGTLLTQGRGRSTHTVSCISWTYLENSRAVAQGWGHIEKHQCSF